MVEVDEFTPRAYQIELFEQTVERNTIIYLPTGSGKTYIAILLIKKLSGDLQKSYSQGGKHTLFIVNTVPLVKQQSEYIARHTGLLCGGYCGDMQVDNWSVKEWSKELEKNRVLVMTAQICLDVLCHGYMQLNRVNLLICDECHRAVNNHPMRLIMKHFENYPIQEQPRVLALSASLLNCNVQLGKVAATIEELEITFHSKIATVNSVDYVKKYCTSPKESIVQFEPYTLPDTVKHIDNVLDEMNSVLSVISLENPLVLNESSTVFQPKPKNKKLQAILTDIKEQFSHGGIYAGSKSVLLHMIQVECIKKYTQHADTVHVLEYLSTGLTKLRKILTDEMKSSSKLEHIHKYSSDQVRKLFAVLKNFYDNKTNDQKFCCIIFVQRRFTAKVLYHVLKNLRDRDENYKFLKPDFIIGFSNDPYKNVKETMCIAKWNMEVLHRFKNGLSNCILATDVIDEGIDVPLCTLIIRYNLPNDFRAYIQSKGRARYETSHYTLLLPKDDTTFLSRLQNFKTVELHLQSFLVGKTDMRKQPTPAEIEERLYNTEIEPYVVSFKNGSKSILTEFLAIPLINKYCAVLLRSKFIFLSPTWILHKTQDARDKPFKVSLKLPIVSPVKDVIFGDAMESIDAAKRSAAMKMCIRLHKVGELTDNLLPREADAPIEDVGYLFPNWEDEEKSQLRVIGTYKKKRQHNLQFPDPLYGAFPEPNTKLYLHILHAKPTYSTQLDNRNLVFYNLLFNNAGFAILSAKTIPQVPSFPIFMNVGELNVTIKVNHSTVELSSKEIEELRVFHSLVFNQIVPVIKPFMVFDRDNLDNSFLIVPVNENFEINWDVVKRHKCIEHIGPSTPLRFRNSDYDLALVTPSYRGAVSVYVVTQVCDDLTPESSFPIEDFYSYAHYYKDRHCVAIQDRKQPLLEVKPISTRINCIKPRGAKAGLSKRKRANVLEDLEEHLVPELCLKIDFPALYWLKATTLPSIIHRISQLLIAEDLRKTIIAEASLGILEPQNNKWPSLELIDIEKEEPSESLPDTTFDDSIEITQREPELSGPEIDVLNTDANLYPWTKDQEPTDLERNIEQIQIIDIEYYCHFMTGTELETTKQKRTKFVNRSTISVPSLDVFSQNSKHGPDPVQIMYALTSKLGNDEFDLERLETLGDSYLKFIVSLFLYFNFQSYAEGRLTATKGKLIGNRNLYYCGKRKCIPGRMKVDDFVPTSNFIAPAYTAYRQLQQILLDAEVSPNVLYELEIPPEERFAGYISEETKNAIQEKVLKWGAAESQTGLEHFLGVQTVPDKAVADSVEALIGVYLKSMGIKGAAALLKWFGVLPPSLSVNQLFHATPNCPLLSPGDPNVHMPWAAAVEERIGYKFRNRAFLLQAFTHASYTANAMTECYQRLEFLGDAIIDFLITCYIYDNCGNLTPGTLTDLRSALVNNITFACLSVRYGLYTALLAYAPKLNGIIDRFVKFQEDRNHVVNDELLWVLLEEEESNMAEYVDVPKVLGDVFESTVGAIYLDSGKNLSVVWDILYSLMHKEIDEFSNNIPKQPVRVLYETQGARPEFSTATFIEGTGTVMVPLKVFVAGKVKLFHGFGANKKQAKCAAAKQALKSLLHKS